MKVEKLRNLLWELIRNDLADNKQKYGSKRGEFYKTFFQSGHAYLEYELEGEEAERTPPSREILSLFNESPLKDMYEINRKCYASLGRNTVNDTSKLSNPNPIKRCTISFAPFEENLVDDFLDYIYPRIVFANNQNEKFTKLYEQFEAAWLSADISISCFVILRNFYNQCNCEIELDDETKFSGFYSYSFSAPHPANICLFGELDRWLEQAHPHVKREDETQYQCLVLNKTLSKHDLLAGKLPDFYLLARKFIFLARIILGGNVYFDSIGTKSDLISPGGSAQMFGLPGNKVPQALVGETYLTHPFDETFRSLWGNIKTIAYDSIAVADHKYEFALKRSEMTGPAGHAEFQVFNNFDKVLDLFQAIENLIAAPKHHIVHNGTHILKGEYIKIVMARLLFPNDSGKRDDCELFIKRLWTDVRCSYAHGNLDKLMDKYHERHKQMALHDDVSKLRYYFTELAATMIRNPQTIPNKSGNARNMQPIHDLLDGKLSIQTIFGGHDT